MWCGFGRGWTHKVGHPPPNSTHPPPLEVGQNPNPWGCTLILGGVAPPPPPLPTHQAPMCVVVRLGGPTWSPQGPNKAPWPPPPLLSHPPTPHVHPCQAPPLPPPQGGPTPHHMGWEGRLGGFRPRGLRIWPQMVRIPYRSYGTTLPPHLFPWGGEWPSTNLAVSGWGAWGDPPPQPPPSSSWILGPHTHPHSTKVSASGWGGWEAMSIRV